MQPNGIYDLGLFMTQGHNMLLLHPDILLSPFHGSLLEPKFTLAMTLLYLLPTYRQWLCSCENNNLDLFQPGFCVLELLEFLFVDLYKLKCFTLHFLCSLPSCQHV